LKKRVKVFEVGNFAGKGEFSLDRVNELFGSVKEKVQGIFIHSSKWKAEGKEPIGIAEFDNFGVDNNIAYADMELNEKGQKYYDDGIIKGISVEIGKGLNKIALLPLGVNPAIKGTEFQEALEFEEVTIETPIIDIVEETPEAKEVEEAKVKVEEVVAGIKELTHEELETVKSEFQAIEFSMKPVKSEEEMRNEIKAEYEAERTTEKELAEFEEVLNKKVLPLHQEAYKVAFGKSQKESEVIEFSETEKVTMKDHLLSKVKAMGDIELTKEFAKMQGKDQEITDGQKKLNEIKEISEQTNKMYGGK